MSGRFEALPDGGVVASLAEAEIELLRNLPEELRALYDVSNDDDPARARLFPRAYLDPTEESAEEEWQALVHPELLRERLVALSQVAATLDGVEASGDGMAKVVLPPDAVQAWLSVLNDARLALGTRLGVTEDTDYSEFDSDDPNAPAHVAYGWLTYLQGDLVETLLEGMPG
jgi:cell wall assembly regulator SMI1